MKPILIVLSLLIFTGANAQTLAQTTPQVWQTYSVKDEKFSVALPARPVCDYQKILVQRFGKERVEINLGAYADGVVYTIYVIETVQPAQSLDDFIARRIRMGRIWNLTTEHTVTVDGIEGKGFRTLDSTNGAIHFFSRGNRLFQFAAVGAVPEDERIAKFFSSISLTKKKDSIDAFDLRNAPVADDTAAVTATPGIEPERLYTGREVDRRTYIALKLEPRYTESARQNRITGTVVLTCVFAANGQITSISVVKGLTNGLTERAIAAARTIKFIPAMKDGRFVPVRLHLEYNFNLY